MRTRVIGMFLCGMVTGCLSLALVQPAGLQVFDDVEILSTLTVGNSQELDVNANQVRLGGDTPTFNACGSGPTIVGTDNAGLITTGTTAASCNVNFANTWTNAPACVLTSNAAHDLTVGTTTTLLLISGTNDLEAIHYICFGMP